MSVAIVIGTLWMIGFGRNVQRLLWSGASGRRVHSDLLASIQLFSYRWIEMSIFAARTGMMLGTRQVLFPTVATFHSLGMVGERATQSWRSSNVPPVPKLGERAPSWTRD